MAEEEAQVPEENAAGGDAAAGAEAAAEGAVEESPKHRTADIMFKLVTMLTPATEKAQQRVELEAPGCAPSV